MARDPLEEKREANLNSPMLATMPVRPAPPAEPNALGSAARALDAHRPACLNRAIRPPCVRAHLR